MAFSVPGFCCGQSSIQFKWLLQGYIFTFQVEGLYTLIWQCCTVCPLRADSCFSIIMRWSSHFRCIWGSLHLHPTEHMLLHSFQFILSCILPIWNEVYNIDIHSLNFHAIKHCSTNIYCMFEYCHCLTGGVHMFSNNRGPRILEWPVSVTVIWCVVLSTFAMLHLL